MAFAARSAALAVIVVVGGCKSRAAKSDSEVAPLRDVSAFVPTSLTVSYRGPAFAKHAAITTWPPGDDIPALVRPVLNALNAEGGERAAVFREQLPAFVENHRVLTITTRLGSSRVTVRDGALRVSCGMAEFGALSDGEPRPDSKTAWQVAAHRLPLAFAKPVPFAAHKTLKQGNYLGRDRSEFTPLEFEIGLVGQAASDFRKAHRARGSLQCHHLIALIEAKAFTNGVEVPLAYIDAKRLGVRLVSSPRAEILGDTLAP